MMPKLQRRYGEPHPSFFSLSRPDRDAIAFGYQVEKPTDTFRAKALSSLEDGFERFPRTAFSTDFPGLYTRRHFEKRLKPALETLGIRWQNYGFDPVDGFIINFWSSEDAVAAKLAYEEE